ncbi:hypothetical protein D3C81_1786800 [compost metagenome]
MFTQHAKAVRIIDHQPCTMLFAQGQQLRQCGQVAIHAEDTISHHHLACGGAGSQQGGELIQVAMRIDLHIGTRQARTVDQ